MTFDADFYLSRIKELHLAVREVVREQQKKFTTADLSQVAAQGSGDVSYKIDVGAEERINKFFANFERPVIVISEATGRETFPKGINEEDCEAVIIIDPIDGTRPIMYNLDSAFVLTGVAPYKGPETSLKDIEIAVQTELPTTRAFLADQLYAIKGKGAKSDEWNLIDNRVRRQIVPQPSQASTIKHGFAMLIKYFPGGKNILAEVEEELFRNVLGPVQKGKALGFDHQYISSAGVFYRTLVGSYRFCGDIRPWLEPILAKHGSELGLCAHPYDVCTKLIGDEIGVITTDLQGHELDCPLDTQTNVGSLVYANRHIRNEIEGPLLAAMERVAKKYLA
jgi:fructose-1,6-bisphosphatase/inositol monophosphatase family enzyme